MNADQSPEENRLAKRQLARPFLIGALVQFLWVAVACAIFRYTPRGFVSLRVVLLLASPFPLALVTRVLWRLARCPNSAHREAKAAFGNGGIVGFLIGGGGVLTILFHVWR